MRKLKTIFAVLAVMIISASVFAACEKVEEDTGIYTVTYNLNLTGANLTANDITTFTDTVEVNRDEALPALTLSIKGSASNPDKRAFKGWYTDKTCTEEWNSKRGVTSNMTLYAKWEKNIPRVLLPERREGA